MYIITSIMHVPICVGFLIHRNWAKFVSRAVLSIIVIDTDFE